MSTHPPAETAPATADTVNVSFDGRPIKASAGQSVGAALVSNGITAWRTTRKEGRPRGLYCGIGVCFDCLVTIDDEPNQRACLVQACEGMVIEGSCGPDVDLLPERERGQR